MMTSLCTKFYEFILAQGILLGVSLALLVCPMLALVGQYIKVKRGAAMGIVIAGSSLGGVIWPIVINELLKKPNIRFEWTMRIVGFIMMPLLAVSCLCCRPPKAPAAMKTLPERPDANEGAIPDQEPVNTPRTGFSILREPKMQVTCLAFFVTYFGMFSPFFFTTSYAVAQGFSADLSFYTISIINGASFFGRIIPGILADRYGRFNTCIVATLLSGVIALCWTTATSVAGLVVWSAAYGFTSGVRLGQLFSSFHNNADTLLGYSLPSTSVCSPNSNIKDLGLVNWCCHGIYISLVCTYKFQHAKLIFSQRNGRYPYQW
jgi:MFS family permease